MIGELRGADDPVSGSLAYVAYSTLRCRLLRELVARLARRSSDDGGANRTISSLAEDVTRLRLALGCLESRNVRTAHFDDPRQAEFQVFSQWGEDGIIQYLIGKVPIAETTFIEFGVEDYTESNTRFLLCNDNWRGLVIDGGDLHLQFLEKSGLKWRRDITAIRAFIDRENINSLLAASGMAGDIGLLSVDIDGNDYWVLEAITAVSPRIVIVEYNSLFGSRAAVSVPYRADFHRSRAHYSNLYYGASLAALCHWASRSDYSLVCTNSAGNNAFFVRNDVRGELRPLSPEEGWVSSRFRESRDQEGALTYLSSHAERLRLIADLPVVDVTSGRQARVGDLQLG